MHFLCSFSLWRYRTGGIFAKDHHSHHDDDDTRSAEPLLDLAPEERWLAVILYRCIAHVRACGCSYLV